MNRHSLANYFVLASFFAVAYRCLLGSSLAHYDADESPILKTIDPNQHEPDPFGILKISSLYGPGSWAAWVLTLICMVFGGSNFNLVSYVLYFIVSTVDILSRYY